MCTGKLEAGLKKKLIWRKTEMKLPGGNELCHSRDPATRYNGSDFQESGKAVHFREKGYCGVVAGNVTRTKDNWRGLMRRSRSGLPSCELKKNNPLLRKEDGKKRVEVRTNNSRTSEPKGESTGNTNKHNSEGAADLRKRGWEVFFSRARKEYLGTEQEVAAETGLIYL